MKRLMFNLLETMARDAGCSDEAWELVAEFATAEGVLRGAAPHRQPGLDTESARAFDVPAEAMVRCLSREEAGVVPQTSQWDLFDIAAYNEWLEADELDELMPGLYDAMPRTAPGGGGFAASAFIEPELLLDSWPPDRAELDFEEADDFDDAPRLSGFEKH